MDLNDSLSLNLANNTIGLLADAIADGMEKYSDAMQEGRNIFSTSYEIMFDDEMLLIEIREKIGEVKQLLDRFCEAECAVLIGVDKRKETEGRYHRRINEESMHQLNVSLGSMFLNKSIKHQSENKQSNNHSAVENSIHQQCNSRLSDSISFESKDQETVAFDRPSEKLECEEAAMVSMIESLNITVDPEIEVTPPEITTEIAIQRATTTIDEHDFENTKSVDSLETGTQKGTDQSNEMERLLSTEKNIASDERKYSECENKLENSAQSTESKTIGHVVVLTESSVDKKFKGKKVQARFECNECEFNTNGCCAFELHSHMHSGEKSTKCKNCGKQFHAKSICEYMLEQLPCPVCKKLFMHKSHLIRHMYIHTLENTYNCKVCDKGFARKDSYDAHVSRLHKAETFKLRKCSIRLRRLTSDEIERATNRSLVKSFKSRSHKHQIKSFKSLIEPKSSSRRAFQRINK